MNEWPNPTNFLRPSFNPPVTAPDVDPTSGVLIKVAYNPAWTAILEGAASQMLQYAAFEGTDDEKKLATSRALLLMEALALDLSTVDTPYWDDETDVGDEEPSDTQVWYGEVTNPEAPPEELDFVENATVWIFTGLLALATPELGFAPAIAFNTIAPRFIIAQKRGDFGTVIDIFLNRDHVGHVDTTSSNAGDIIEIPIVSDGGGDILIMNTLP